MALPQAMLRGGDVLDDENLLAGLDQAELAARDFFDGGRVFAQPPGLIAQPRVLGPLARDGRRQLVVLAAGAQHRQQPAVADQGVEDDGRRDEDQQHVQQPAVARARGSASGYGGGGLRSVSGRHVATNSTTTRCKVQT